MGQNSSGPTGQVFIIEVDSAKSLAVTSSSHELEPKFVLSSNVLSNFLDNRYKKMCPFCATNSEPILQSAVITSNYRQTWRPS